MIEIWVVSGCLHQADQVILAGMAHTAPLLPNLQGNMKMRPLNAFENLANLFVAYEAAVTGDLLDAATIEEKLEAALEATGVGDDYEPIYGEAGLVGVLIDLPNGGSLVLDLPSATTQPAKHHAFQVGQTVAWRQASGVLHAVSVLTEVADDGTVRIEHDDFERTVPVSELEPLV